MKNSIWTYNEYKLPVWAICAIEYNDYSAFDTDEESEKIKAFLKSLPSDKGNIEWPENIDTAKYFSHNNDIDNLGCDVVECKYHYQTSDIKIIIATVENQAREIKELDAALKESEIEVSALEKQVEQLEYEDSAKVESLQSCLDEYEELDIPEVKTLGDENRLKELLKQF